jgi:hypothetical protein
MKKILFNYAHNKFLNSQVHNSETGLKIGNFDKVYQFRFEDIDKDFYEKNKHILNQHRGAGYWLWKYYFAVKLLNDSSITEEDRIFYCDSGSEFVNSINSMIDVFDRDNLSVMTFLQLHKSAFWTKRDAFVYTNCDEPRFTETSQRVGGFFMFKKDDFSIKFFNELLHYGQDYRIITDAPNQCGLPNYSGFRDHRHDESLISIIAKKYELYPYRNPCQFGLEEIVKASDNIYTRENYNTFISKGGYNYGTFEQYPPIIIDDKSTYPTIINLTRNPK